MKTSLFFLLFLTSGFFSTLTCSQAQEIELSELDDAQIAQADESFAISTARLVAECSNSESCESSVNMNRGIDILINACNSSLDKSAKDLEAMRNRIKKQAFYAALCNDHKLLADAFKEQNLFNKSFNFKKIELLENTAHVTNEEKENRKHTDGKNGLFYSKLIDIVLEKDNADTLAVLIENGLPLYSFDSNGSNLLDAAMKSMAEKIVAFLLDPKFGININRQDAQGNTALHATLQSHMFLPFCKKLIELKAKADIKNNKNLTVFEIAFCCAHKDDPFFKIFSEYLIDHSHETMAVENAHSPKKARKS